ncbi:MAG: GNAT family N-acetyltransferase [Alphaproteobacteria bacterium]|nr:GNAT family N-acetyltransferase [Alphaproteobacteria bacterium]
MRMRRAEAADIEGIRACAAAAFEPYRSRMDRPPAPLLADYARLVGDGKAFVLVENRIVGFIVHYPRQDHLFVETMAVLPDAQHRGYGRMLLVQAEETAMRLRLAAIELYTNEAMTENLRYYPRHGFREVRRSVDDGYRRVWFRKSLANPP